jgi:hypothetical protein
MRSKYNLTENSFKNIHDHNQEQENYSHKLEVVVVFLLFQEHELEDVKGSIFLLGCDNVEFIAMKKGNFICGIGYSEIALIKGFPRTSYMNLK